MIGLFRDLEARAEAEREQLFLWLPVAMGAAIALWFLLPDSAGWAGAVSLLLAAAALALVPRHSRAGRAIAIAALAAAFGLGGIWAKAAWLDSRAGQALGRPAIVTFDGRVERIERLAARGLVRVRLAVLSTTSRDRPYGGESAGSRSARNGDARLPSPALSPILPPIVRVNIADADLPDGDPLSIGADIRLRARLMPPPPPAVPGAYDFARVAWFDGIGAVGRALGPISVVTPGHSPGQGLRARLSSHIEQRLPGSVGGIASALATGDEGAIAQEDAEAMRRAGLAHLLSVSGLHITAVVAATMLVALRLMALWPWAALRLPLPIIAAGAGAVAAIGYTLLTGAEVPTVRSCIAALLVLAALAMGREALTLRLVATGAIVVLLLWPEAAAGPSFQLSFAAITAIIAFHGHPRVRVMFDRRAEGWPRRLLRGLASLVATGVVVEAALSPIALFHFHKAGLYGALANIIAIPLTTFVIMPLEALALLLDGAGLGGPIWLIVHFAIAGLLQLAHDVSEAPGAVAALPGMPVGAYAVIIAGGLWMMLWSTRWRVWGLVPVMLGVIWTLVTPPPDVIVTGDGRHVALRTADGGLAMLRDRAGDYTMAMLAENGGIDGVPGAIADMADARCNRDVCIATVLSGGRQWRVLATRSAYLVPAADLIRACAVADIVVSDRRLPRGCRPRWLRLDRPALAQTGGVAIRLSSGSVTTVNMPGGAHPWR